MDQFKLSELKEKVNPTYDAFIVSASFEERCLSIPMSILQKIEFKKKYIVALTHNRRFIEHNFSLLRSQYNFEPLDVDSTNQMKSVNNYLTAINYTLNDNPKASFLIDISTFTRQNLLILIRLLRNTLSKKDNIIHFVYTIAEDYAKDKDEKDKWLSRGIINVNSVFGFAGIISPSKPYHLIIMMGYEVERAAALIYEYEPTKISIGLGDKQRSNHKHYEINKIRFERLIDEFPNAEKFEFSCFDIIACKNEILTQVNKYPNYNVVISPMNNKLSTLSLGLSSFENKNIQVVIALPAIYNYYGYSTPSQDCIFFDGTDIILKQVK